MIESNNTVGSEQKTAQTDPIAPLFTARIRLSFGKMDLVSSPTLGSLSFGKTQMTVVSQDGDHWDKIAYQDIMNLKRAGNSLIFDLKGIETKLSVYPNGVFNQIVDALPYFGPKAQEKRLVILQGFIDLFSVKKSF